ncbi:tumor necrosis factor-like [Solea senegalensis]|uniref:Tumor necrosis factor-like n=1 Tax=Solea senegalensis TaxID=28829 RepID=A0AAV6R6N3_SOLSE|nr:tumor necrosis factor-like [Solea senegalensis]
MMGPNPAGGTCGGDAERSLGNCDDTALILIKHCRNMRRQDLLLRLINLLVLTCAAFFICSTCAGSWTRQSSGEQTSTEEQRAVSLKQESQFPSEPATTKNNNQRFNIQLRSLSDSNTEVKWEVENLDMRSQYKEERRAIVIPHDGVYFIYARFQLACHREFPLKFSPLWVELNWWSEAYGPPQSLMQVKDGLLCENRSMGGGYRNVFVGQLFNLTTDYHVSVKVVKGYELITMAYFGAYLT